MSSEQRHQIWFDLILILQVMVCLCGNILYWSVFSEILYHVMKVHFSQQVMLAATTGAAILALYMYLESQVTATVKPLI